MLITAFGLLGLCTIGIDTPYWQLALWQLIIGAGSGLFISPNTSAVMGVVPPEKRGMGSGARMMLTQTGFVISIALSIGLVSSVMDPSVLLSIFSGTQIGSGSIDMDPFIQALHIAFGVGVVASLLGAVVSASRGGKQVIEDEPTVQGSVAA
jgi:MFS family permease